MPENFLNLNYWYFITFIYLFVGFLLSRGVIGSVTRVMSIIGWPIELAQRLSGTKSLPYLFLFPNILIFGLFTFLPLFMNFGFSVTDGESINFSSRDYSGSDNLSRIILEKQIDTGLENMEDDKFKAAIADTFVFVLFQVPIMIVIALITAIILNREIIGRAFWRAVYFYPVMLSPVVVAFLWTLILKRQGLLSQMLMGWNWIDEPIQWLTDPSWTMFWSVLIYTWANLGFYMLILLAGLQSIPRDLYEAAEMDGATPFQKFWELWLPQLAGILAVLFLLRFIWTFNKFDDIFLLTGGAAGTRTLTVSVYEQAFAINNLGAGCAVAVVISFLLGLFALAYFCSLPTEEGL